MDDLISRQAAIDAVNEWMDETFGAEIKKYGGAMIRLTKLPSADRKRGRWIIEPGIGCKCSNCDFDIGNDLDFMEYVSYCPNCGAEMRGEEGAE